MHIKFSFSEKATKICTIVLMVLTITYVKTIRKIALIFVAFSEKLNFTNFTRKMYRPELFKFELIPVKLRSFIKFKREFITGLTPL